MLSPRVGRGGRLPLGNLTFLGRVKFPKGEGGSHMKGTGMLVRKSEFNPKGDQSGCGSGFIGPLKETMLKQTAK